MTPVRRAYATERDSRHKVDLSNIADTCARRICGLSIIVVFNMTSLPLLMPKADFRLFKTAVSVQDLQPGTSY